MIVSMRVRRSAPVALTALALAACADSPTAPSPGLGPAALASEPSLGRSKWLHRVKAHKTYDHDSKNVVYTFTVDPSKSHIVKLGEHTVFLPAKVICDPATSSYGIAEWEKPCTPAKSPVTFQAIAGTRNGHAAVEFEPDVRFAPAPANQPWRWVILTLTEPKTLHDKKDYSILWWDADAVTSSGSGSENLGAWVDEAVSDPTLRAWTDRSGNRVSRRLKHFSGYNVTSGRSDRRSGAR